MVDQTNQAIDMVLPLKDRVDGNEDEDEDEKIIDLSAYKTSAGRPLYMIKRKKYIEIIQQQLQAKNRLLLKAFNTYAYYSCEITEMQQKVFEHLANTSAYALIMELSPTNQHCLENYLDKINKQITLTLNNLLHDQYITLSQWQKMKVNQTETYIDVLFFLPDTRKKNVPFHPLTMNSRHSSLIKKISCFLSRHLQPIYDRVTHLNTFNTSVDVIDAIEEYNKNGFLRLNTRFVTICIDNLATIIPHEQIIATLQRFLHQYIIDGRIAGITIQNIIDLVQLFLENQYLIYDNKLYQQIRGGIYNFPLTTILANIYIHYWQQGLVTILDKKNEIFGRYFGDIFLTWNESDDKLYHILHTINNNQQFIDIQMAVTISNNINYLDVNIHHIDGDLKIQVAHNLDTEPYSLPYVVGAHHQRYQYSTLLRATFIRSVRCYTDVFDFANELQDIQLSFQYNGFEQDFFIDQFQLFLQEFDTKELKLHYGEAYYDQSLYDYLRENIFNYNQNQKKAKLKQLQQQTIQYRWPYSLNHDF